MLTLYLHDGEGHTRITYIRLVTDDTLADEFRPIASASMIENEVTDEYVTLDGTKTVAGVDWPVYRTRLSDTGDLSISFTAQDSYDPDAPEGERGVVLYEWKVFFDYPWDSQNPTLQGHEFQIPAAAGDDWTYVFRNLTSSPDGNLENQIRVELIVYDKAGKQSEKARMYFVVVGEDFGDDEPVVDFTKPRPQDSQSEDLVTITGSLVSGAENSDVVIEVALTEAVLDYTTTQKITQKSIGKYNKTDLLADGQQFTLTLDISDLYQETGVAATIYVRITEGDGSRYVISDTLAINLLPDLPVLPKDQGEGMSMLLIGGIGVVILLLVVVVTVVMRGRGKEDSGEDTVEQFGGVEEMDPVEAYVQQMVASGYDEQTARQYAQQYYAQYYEQQRRDGG